MNLYPYYFSIVENLLYLISSVRRELNKDKHEKIH